MTFSNNRNVSYGDSVFCKVFKSIKLIAIQYYLAAFDFSKSVFDMQCGNGIGNNFPQLANHIRSQLYLIINDKRRNENIVGTALECFSSMFSLKKRNQYSYLTNDIMLFYSIAHLSLND